MDSVIAKLDRSVFGMLIEQEPHIMILGVTEEDLDLVNAARPDFVCLEDGSIKEKIHSTVRVLDSPDNLPVISGTDDPGALKISSSEDFREIQKIRPDTVILELIRHDEEEHEEIRRLIQKIRAMKPDMVD